jgi:hypothetical protein
MKTLIAFCLCGLSIPLLAQTTLRTFTSPDGIFQFKYSDLLVDCTSVGPQENGAGSSLPESCISQGGLCGDASSDASTIACYAYPRDRFKDKPAFVAAAFFAAEFKAATSRKTCLEGSQWNVEGIESATINGAHFKVFHVSDNGMGNSLDEHLYRTFHQGKCYELGIQTATSTRGEDDPAGTIKEFTKKDSDEVQGRLKHAVHSFRFLK